ncbi:putative disease resistance protein RGA4 isoform X8 [Vitis riparia]|uniref:putative disease resistance protein RGA4 isoform X8 n=1 Tax=Vitis riparia TaxID=96939 RepID=UPI00155A3300|nr:putative disease resistance protein RGA4 isoform X8 [Vitis riparia]
MEAVSLVRLTSSIARLIPLLVKGILWLRAFKDDLEKLLRTSRIIQDILTNMDEEQLDLDVMQNWIKDLKDAAYDAEDLVDRLATEAYPRQHQVSLPRGMDFRKISSQFNTKKLNERFDHIRKNAKFIRCVVPTEGGRTSIPVPQEMSTDMTTIVGREADTKKIVDMLLDRKYDTEFGIPVIRIVGMTGKGKTAVAQLVYLHARVVKRFKENRIWVCVTVNFDLSRILRDIMMRSNPNINHTNSSLNQLCEDFQKFVRGKCFLLVLDDVWTDNDEEWKRLLYLLREGAKQSRVLATSQKTEVCHVQYMQITHNLNFLSYDDCWSLFQRTAFGQDDCPSQLVESGTRIVRKCQNLPLAVKAMASFLGRNLDPKKWRRISELDIWEAEKGESKSTSPSIFPAMKVSYNHLPSHLKPLFCYCSIFPKGYSFDKKELVQLWIAEDLIQFQGQKRIEEIAGEYFNELLTRSFFQSPDVDRKRYWMHDLFHNLAQSISGPYYCLVKEDNTQYDFSEQTHHVSLMCRNVEKPVLDVIDKSKKVRTLLLPSNYLTDFGQALDKRFGRMKYIRVLDLSSSTILAVPNSIQELKLLRYLNLSKTEIRSLPAFLCKLHNLQTLLLLGCVFLSKLPKNIAKLINLRHLELDEVFWHKTTKLPPRIGSLTSLQNLHAFPVRCGDGYGIKELKGMAKLTGSLRISNLENAVKAGEAKLNEKESLDKLVLEWSSRIAPPLDEAAEVKVLEDLRPHSDLKELHISNFWGTTFPLWMTDGQLQNLVTVSLKYCERCKALSLGALPHLQKLNIKGMQELQELKQSGEYPSLASLKISNCPKLTKLPSHFRKLEDVKIKGCNSLKVLAVTPFLKVLVLVDNIVLEDLNEANCSFSSLLELKIYGCPKLETLPQTFTPKKVEIGGCKLLRALPAPESCQQLQHLLLDECEDGTLVGTIPKTSSLNSLVISNISKAVSFPKWPHLPGLKALHILHCKDLVYFSQEASPFPSLTSLKFLSIRWCSQLVTLPDKGLPKSLECLSLASCHNLQSLGPDDALKSLTSLKDLYIKDCPKLSSLPEEGVSISLQHLVIQGCPILVERCTEDDGGGPDWGKIKDITDREIGSTEVSSSLDLSNQIQDHPKASSTRWHHPFVKYWKGGTSKGKEHAEPSNLAEEHRGTSKGKEPETPSILVQHGGTSKGKEPETPSILVQHGGTSKGKEPKTPSILVQHGQTLNEELEKASILVKNGGTSKEKELEEPSILVHKREHSKGKQKGKPREISNKKEEEKPPILVQHGTSKGKETKKPSNLVQQRRTSKGKEQETPSMLLQQRGTSKGEKIKKQSISVQHGGTSEGKKLEKPSILVHQRGTSKGKEPDKPSNLVQHRGTSKGKQPEEPSFLVHQRGTSKRKELGKPSILVQHRGTSKGKQPEEPSFLVHQRGTSKRKELGKPSILVQHRGTSKGKQPKEPSFLVHQRGTLKEKELEKPTILVQHRRTLEEKEPEKPSV